MTVHQMLLGNTRLPKLDFMGTYHQPTASAAPTVAGCAFGDASGDRIITAVTIGFGPPTGVASAVTIGGIAATIHVNNRIGTGTVLTIASAVVPSGTTGNVQTTYPSATSNSGYFAFVYRVSGMKSPTPVQILLDAVTPFSVGVTCDTKSAVIGGFTVYQNGGTTVNWSGTAGLVENADYTSGGLAGVGSVASLLTSTALAGATVAAVAVSGSSNAAQMGVIAFT